jgi:hypothetical protein
MMTGLEKSVGGRVAWHVRNARLAPLVGGSSP